MKVGWGDREDFEGAASCEELHQELSLGIQPHEEPRAVGVRQQELGVVSAFYLADSSPRGLFERTSQSIPNHKRKSKGACLPRGLRLVSSMLKHKWRLTRGYRWCLCLGWCCRRYCQRKSPIRGWSRPAVRGNLQRLGQGLSAWVVWMSEGNIYF